MSLNWVVKYALMPRKCLDTFFTFSIMLIIESLVVADDQALYGRNNERKSQNYNKEACRTLGRNSIVDLRLSLIMMNNELREEQLMSPVTSVPTYP